MLDALTQTPKPENDMPGSSSTADQPQLAVYWDLENLVLSQYDEVFGRDAWRNAKYSRRRPAAGALEKLRDAWVDVPAVLEYAAGQGTIVVNRAYGDWRRAGTGSSSSRT